MRCCRFSLAATLLSGCSYNRFVSQEEAVKAQWAQVQNQLQRRNDLIPNLVETVKGYASHEKEVFQQIAESRAKLAGAQTPADAMAAANQQSAALARLLVIVEQYPNLKANEQFNRLSDELAGTENRIAVERMRYNERVQEYNTSRRQFPGVDYGEDFQFQGLPAVRGAAGRTAGAEGELLGLRLSPAALEQLALKIERALDEVVGLVEPFHPLRAVGGRHDHLVTRLPRLRGGSRTAFVHPSVQRSTASPNLYRA